ncbi:MAG: hypothetical protein II249_07560, partial [Bacteroidaceae bacterium]|nr:hypothetical protein [Bacteroidaceae bacterium]
MSWGAEDKSWLCLAVCGIGQGSPILPRLRSVKNTYGTGCFLLMNSGERPIMSSNNLLTTVAWKIGDTVNYAL